jgi:hypothetical protein
MKSRLGLRLILLLSAFALAPNQRGSEDEDLGIEPGKVLPLAGILTGAII